MNRFFKKRLVLSPKKIIRFYDFFRIIGALGFWFNLKIDSNTRFKPFFNKSKLISENYTINSANLINHDLKDGYIENQSEFHDMKYGTMPLSYSGCEIIAVYNALNFFNDTVSLPSLIKYFESNGAALGGELGTAPMALVYYFINRRYNIVYSYEQEDFDEIANISAALILTAYNDKNDITKMIHTICITKKNGLFTVHNCSQKPYYENINDLIREIGGNNNGKGILLIGIINM